MKDEIINIIGNDIISKSFRAILLDDLIDILASEARPFNRMNTIYFLRDFILENSLFVFRSSDLAYDNVLEGYIGIVSEFYGIKDILPSDDFEKNIGEICNISFGDLAIPLDDFLYFFKGDLSFLDEKGSDEVFYIRRKVNENFTISLIGERVEGIKSAILQKTTDETTTLNHRITDLEQQLSHAQAKNAELLAEVESLKKAQVQPLIESQECEGNTPPRTDRDKLRQFIELIADPDLLDNDGKGGKKLPPYSTLHTRLNNKHRHKKVPSKNTIGKYLNEID